MPSSDTYFQPGHAKIPGAGRPPGAPNKHPPLAAPAVDHLTASLVPSLQAALEKMAAGKDFERRAERYVTQVIRLLHVTDRLGSGKLREGPYEQATAEDAAMDASSPFKKPIVFADDDSPDPAIKAAEDTLFSMGNTLIGLYQEMTDMINNHGAIDAIDDDNCLETEEPPKADGTE